jgi:hypothetical protein
MSMLNSAGSAVSFAAEAISVAAPAWAVRYDLDWFPSPLVQDWFPSPLVQSERRRGRVTIEQIFADLTARSRRQGHGRGSE